MSMKQKTSDLLSICFKAGKAVKGFDSACEAAAKGKAKCILTACDASAKTVKEAEFYCKKYGIPMMRTELTKDDIGAVCRKQTAVIGICDEGFCKGFAKILNKTPEDGGKE